jgi:hypothetical protein
MRQPAIPKLSELITAGRAELLTIWTDPWSPPVDQGRGPARLRMLLFAWIKF